MEHDKMRQDVSNIITDVSYYLRSVAKRRGEIGGAGRIVRGREMVED
jgi:hypothetical protein